MNDNRTFFKLKMEERIPFDDAHFEAKKGKFEMKVPEDVVCESKNEIMKLCINPECIMTSLTCDKKGCPTCSNLQHIRCPKVDLKGVAQGINFHIPTK